MIIGQAYLLSHVIHGVFLLGHSLAEVQTTLLILLGLAWLRAGTIWLTQRTAQRTASLVKQELRTRLISHLFALGPTYAQSERSGELSHVLGEGIEALDAYLTQYLPRLLLAVLIPLLILGFVLPLDGLSALVLLMTAPLIPIFMALIGSMAKERTERQWAELSRMSAHFLDMLQGLTTLKILGRSREQIDRIGRISQQFGDTTLGVLRIAFLSSLVLELLASLSIAVVAVEIGLRLMNGFMGFEAALTILILAPEFYLPLRALGSGFHASMAGSEAAERIFEILGEPLTPPSPNNNEPALAPTPPQQNNNRAGLKPSPPLVQFQAVSYHYPQAEQPAIRNLTVTLPAHQVTALVGPSGAGKSTLAHLLLRFITPQQGTVYVHGQPLNQLEPERWRAQIGWVSQRPYLFHASIADNLRLARPEATVAELRIAAQQAHLHDVIEQLPQQYDTIIGEQGNRLSGGQRQRLALARAFLKNAPLLILDEATANLDPEHEAAIQTSLQTLMKNRTVLMIAHRLNTLHQADQILVMQHGEIVQAGPHQHLAQQPGLYRQLLESLGLTQNFRES